MKTRRMAVLAVFMLSALMAQSPVPATAPAPKFEVASVKATQSPMELMRAGRGGVAMGTVFSGSRVQIGSTPLKNLVATAFRTDIQHVNAPAWSLQTYFTIEAIMPDGATKEQFPDMLRALLEDRFHMVARRTESDQPGYALTLTATGHKLKPAAEVNRSGCDTWTDDRALAGAKTCTVVLQPDGDRITVTIRTDTKWGPQRTEQSRRASDVEFFAITMPQLADYLAGTLKAGPGLAQAPVVPILDRTGLQGTWHLTVERVFSDAAMSPPDGPVQRMPITSSLIADELAAGISKFGLKLGKITTPIEMIAIDQLDQAPTEN